MEGGDPRAKNRRMSIDYELAKELKDAGFPEGEGQRIHDHTVNPPLHYYLPALEELIEEVERDGWFGFSLEHNHINDEWDAWIIENVGHKSLLEATMLHSGSTPTEAVARLWLALNKKT